MTRDEGVDYMALTRGTFVVACWLCGGSIPVEHPSVRQITPCSACIEKLRGVMAEFAARERKETT